MNLSIDGDRRQHAIMVAKQMDGLLWGEGGGGGHSLNFPTYSHLIRYQHEVEVTTIISREFNRESVYQISQPPFPHPYSYVSYLILQGL